MKCCSLYANLQVITEQATSLLPRGGSMVCSLSASLEPSRDQKPFRQATEIPVFRLYSAPCVYQLRDAPSLLWAQQGFLT